MGKDTDKFRNLQEKHEKNILREDDSTNRLHIFILFSRISAKYRRLFLGFRQFLKDYFSDFSNYTYICS